MLPDRDSDAAEPAAEPAPAVDDAPSGSTRAAEPWAVVQPQVQTLADSADRALRRVPNLTSGERSRLRRDVNERQIQRARALGVRAGSGRLNALARAGRLVRLAQDTSLWVVRELDYSEPFVTPAAHAMLVEIGERFHRRLDSLGVPRYRLDITSVLRTPEKQAALRRANANASRIESAHEYGTTLDIAYRRFAPPAQHPGAALAGAERTAADSVLIEAGRLRGAELQAVLGRVMLELQRQGKLLVRMERSQTVYHITVGRRLGQRRG